MFFYVLYEKSLIQWTADENTGKVDVSFNIIFTADVKSHKTKSDLVFLMLHYANFGVHVNCLA